MHICIYLCIYIHIYCIQVYIYIYLCLYIYMYIHKDCIYTQTHIFMRAYAYTHILHIYTYIYAYIYRYKLHQDTPIDFFQYKSISLLLSHHSSCLPLCSKWTYPVFSASYGSIQYRDKEEEKRQLANRSWSRIRVIMPDRFYTSNQERKLSVTYITICKIGSVMNAYAGLSIISFAEILFYGAHIVWFRRKLIRRDRRIHPAAAKKKRTSI